VHAPELARALVDAGFAVLVFDLRAHGRSGGERLDLGLLERQDVAAAVEFLLSEEGFKAGKIGIHASSYGAATTLLATPDIAAIGAVVSDSAFANAGEMVGRETQRQTGLPGWCTSALMPGTRLMGRLMFSLDFDNSPEQAVARIEPRPILLIHGEEDTLTPVEHAERLRQAAPTAELWLLPGCDHAEGVRLNNGEPSPMREAYLNKVKHFFNGHLK
jgi:alpha-beta hydrolase superfamily lysophospholipase